MTFDPFGDANTHGYLRNTLATNDRRLIRRIEENTFRANLPAAFEHLSDRQVVRYEDIKATHRMLFASFYPWAGEDRMTLAPTLAISRGGIDGMFAHPADIERAAEYALGNGNDPDRMRRRPGEIFGALAHAHPFLEGNGRTILAVHTELAARAGFHIRWGEIETQTFLKTLTAELDRPGSAMDDLLARHRGVGPLPRLARIASLIGRGNARNSTPEP